MQYMTMPGVQGICPSGWYLPTDAEWTSLSTILGGESVAGGKMKSTGTIQGGTGLWYTPNTGATNESGFTGLPGGNRDLPNGIFANYNSSALFWSSSQDNATHAWSRNLHYYYIYLGKFGSNYKACGYSIRCVKNQDAP